MFNNQRKQQFEWPIVVSTIPKLCLDLILDKKQTYELFIETALKNAPTFQREKKEKRKRW